MGLKGAGGKTFQKRISPWLR